MMDQLSCGLHQVGKTDARMIVERANAANIPTAPPPLHAAGRIG